MLATVIALIEALLPNIGVGATAVSIVDAILSTLASLVPAIVAAEQELLPAVQNIIAALSANPATTAAQLVTLQALDAQCDAAFEAAAVAAGAAPAAN